MFLFRRRRLILTKSLRVLVLGVGMENCGPESSSKSLEPPANVVAEAVRIGAESPCAKSKRGVVIWLSDQDLSHLAGCLDGVRYVVEACAHNARPDGPCDGSDACRRDCGKVAVHAEEAAILKCADLRSWAEEWFRNGHRKQIVVEMLHVKVVDGQAVPGGPPSCWQCSRLILAAKVDYMWLLEDGRGWVRRTAEDFHRETLQNCGLYGQ